MIRTLLEDTPRRKATLGVAALLFAVTALLGVWVATDDAPAGAESRSAVGEATENARPQMIGCYHTGAGQTPPEGASAPNDERLSGASYIPDDGSDPVTQCEEAGVLLPEDLPAVVCDHRGERVIVPEAVGCAALQD